ncbi:hypothetical protein Daesc_009115 [Daldinia eschscholtzii]|uniref:Cupin type-2 domain-containing protein n=1 Tax=Daldinia eschscholtzii TaxID=292717 RepID=A0AAX6MA22_9PEZI
MCVVPTIIGVMSGFFSLLPDLLPMILPSQVQITKASDLEAQRGGKDAPMIRQGAVIGKSDRMCATAFIQFQPWMVPNLFQIYSNIVDSPNSQAPMLISSTPPWRARQGHVTSAGADEEPKRHELSPGDFAFIPPWTEHQEINETDENVVWILIRSGPEPVVVYLTGWGGDEAKADSID